MKCTGSNTPQYCSFGVKIRSNINSLFYLDVIEKPRFTYVERHNVKITYENGVNRTLNVCCNGSSYHKDSMLAGAICGQMSTCPSYNTLSRCKTRGQQVCCEVSGVQNNIKIKGYVAWFDGKTSIPLSKTATYVTNWLGMSFHSL